MNTYSILREIAKIAVDVNLGAISGAVNCSVAAAIGAGLTGSDIPKAVAASAVGGAVSCGLVNGALMQYASHSFFPQQKEYLTALAAINYVVKQGIGFEATAWLSFIDRAIAAGIGAKILLNLGLSDIPISTAMKSATVGGILMIPVTLGILYLTDHLITSAIETMEDANKTQVENRRPSR